MNCSENYINKRINIKKRNRIFPLLSRTYNELGRYCGNFTAFHYQPQLEGTALFAERGAEQPSHAVGRELTGWGQRHSLKSHEKSLEQEHTPFLCPAVCGRLRYMPSVQHEVVNRNTWSKMRLRYEEARRKRRRDSRNMRAGKEKNTIFFFKGRKKKSVRQ